MTSVLVSKVPFSDARSVKNIGYICCSWWLILSVIWKAIIWSLISSELFFNHSFNYKRPGASFYNCIILYFGVWWNWFQFDCIFSAFVTKFQMCCCQHQPMEQSHVQYNNRPEIISLARGKLSFKLVLCQKDVFSHHTHTFHKLFSFAHAVHIRT